MGHTTGLRRRTRHLISKSFRRHGHVQLSKKMETFRVGDHVDIIIDAADQKGMPAKYYHGKSGKVFNVNRHAVGVIVNKKVGNRIMHKRINVRTAHVRKSAHRAAFLKRIQENDRLKAEAKKAGKTISTKRIPKQPREASVIEGEYETVNPLRHRYIF